MQDNKSIPAKRLPRATRERQIVDAAVDVFSRRGYHAASMDEISAVADISKPMVYVYLGSKEALFVTATRREIVKLTNLVTKGMAQAGPEPAERLWRGLLAFFGFVGEYPAGWRVLHRQATMQGVPFVDELFDMRLQAITVVSELLRGVAKSHGKHDELGREMDGLSAAMVGASESLADWWLDHRDQPADTVAGQLMDLMWLGIGNLGKGHRWRSELPPV